MNFMPSKSNKKKNQKGRSSFSFNLAPHFFEKIVLVIGVVLIWRGIWNLIDQYFLINNQLLSNLASVLLGLILIYLPDGNFDDLG